MTPESILRFWFEDLTPQQHFAKDAGLDAAIAQRFGATLEAAARGELFAWRAGAQGRLAEIVVLDQFSRNIHRDTPQAFAQDGMALVLAQELVASGQALALPPGRRAFAYMPYMHSESRLVQAEAVRLFAEPGLEGNLPFAQQHRAIIERFGRYPHRNAILGRQSSDEELAFLREPGSSF
ncbi:MAG: DUF924 domain-containing protein [Comamonadaceae bacterium]|nr:DUF924 domain-containing protein [Comamonadaceae bacterium]